MSSIGAINWSEVFDTTIGNGCGLYNNTISYIDSGWEVKIRSFSSYECEICPEGEHPDMDSLTSVLIRLHSTYPDIWKAYIHVSDGEEYICTMDNRFQMCAPDEVATLAIRIMQSYLNQYIAMKNRKAHNSQNSKDEG